MKKIQNGLFFSRSFELRQQIIELYEWSDGDCQPGLLPASALSVRDGKGLKKRGKEADLNLSET